MNKKLSLIGIALVLVLFIIGSIISPVAAENSSAITVNDSSAIMDFPLALNFSARINSQVNIVDVRLRYKIDQMSFADVTSEAFIGIKPDFVINAAYKLDLRKVGGLPPGANLTYWWVVKDAAGTVIESVPNTFQISDNRYKWQTLKQGKVNLFWYQGDSAFAETLMATAQKALVQLQKDTGAVPDRDIFIYIYADSNALQGSMIFPNEWTGGVAFTQYSIIAIGISPGNLVWGQGAMTHELTHNVINQVTFNPYSDLPVWLNEGLAMHNQGTLTTQFTVPLSLAVANNTLFSVRSICSPFSAYSDKASLSYAQSYSLVDYLITQYRADKMLKLLNTFKNGSTYDQAFQTVYGFDIEGLDSQWKLWIKIREAKSP